MALLKGTVDVPVLETLSWGPMHAFEITTWLEERSGRRLIVEDAVTRAGRAHLAAEAVALTEYVDALTTVLATRTAAG
jgi:PadR family transcriptional regulator, regulatory protein PadR